jgi:chromosome segregation ATPase
MSKLILMGSLSLLMTGCAISTLECDPSQGGLLGGLQGISSGCYDQRLSERQQNLESICQIQATTEYEQSGLSQQKTMAKNEWIRLSNQAQVLNDEITKLSKDLNAKQTMTEQAEQRKNSLKKKVNNLHGKTQQLKKAVAQQPAPEQLKQLQAEEQRLKSEVDTLKKDLYLDL